MKVIAADWPRYVSPSYELGDRYEFLSISLKPPLLSKSPFYAKFRMLFRCVFLASDHKFRAYIFRSYVLSNFTATTKHYVPLAHSQLTDYGMCWSTACRYFDIPASCKLGMRTWPLTSLLLVSGECLQMAT